MLALANGPGRMGDGTMGNGFSSGMGAMGLLMMLLWVLLVVFLVLAILAISKYLWKKLCAQTTLIAVLYSRQ